MVKTLVIHLGGHKTGSTSIQSTLARQTWEADASICYPSVLAGRAGAQARSNHGALAAVLTGPPDPALRDQRFALAARRLAASDADLGVLSAERFEHVNPAALHQVIAAHFPEHADSLRLIAYVRPHAERLVSGYAERVKHGVWSGTLEEFAAQMAGVTGLRSFFYHDQFLRWRRVFGPRFTLRPMIRERLVAGDVVRDFLDFALEGRAVRLTEPALRNESASLEDLALLREFHRLAGGGEKPSEAQNKLGVRLARHLNEDPAATRTKLQLHRALAEAVVETYRADAAALDAEFFDGTPMTDALLAAPAKAVETAQSMRAEDHFGAAEMRLIRVWSGFLAELLANAPAAGGKPGGPRAARVLAAASLAADADTDAESGPEPQADAAPMPRRGGGRRGGRRARNPAASGT
jgi:hypothetical protein